MLRFSVSTKTDIDLNSLTIALLNYIISQQKKCGFFVRVEDSDKEQEDESKIQDDLNVLKKFAINTDATVNQSSNLNIYAQLATNLIKTKKAFACFCEEDAKECTQNCKELEQVDIEANVNSGKKYSIRAIKPNKNIKIKDTIVGNVEAKAESIGNVLILKQNGLPSRCFATAVDDMSASITAIVDSQDNLSQTLKQNYLQTLLDYNVDIEYVHIPAISNLNDISLKLLLQEGYLPDTIINYLLAITTKKELELFYLPDAIEWLDVSNISNEPAKFNIDDLKELNRKHLKSINSLALSKIFGFADADIGELLKLYLDNASTIKELDNYIIATFAPKECTKELQELTECIKNAPYIDDYNNFVEYLIENTSINEKEIEEALRVLLTGTKSAINLELVYKYINPYIQEIAKCR